MGGAMPSSDEVPASSLAKAATRELPSKGANIKIMSQGTSALAKDKVPASTTDSGKAVVTKRQHSDTPSSPGYHNVYVRRKVESEHNKVNSSQEQKGNAKDKTKDQQEVPLQDVQHNEVNKVQHDVQHDEINKVQHDEVNKVQHDEVNKIQHDEVNKVQHDEVIKVRHDEVSKPQVVDPVDKPVEVLSSISSAKPNVETVPEKTEPPAASAADIKVDTEQLSIQYWSERLNRLQTYLENCDRSTQEGYLRKLRSLSAAGRSMHAIELEKRAIHLLVEEGKELQRMKALNVLGKVSPNASSKQTPLQRQFQK